jgi:hypothetical protein
MQMTRNSIRLPRAVVIAVFSLIAVAAVAYAADAAKEAAMAGRHAGLASKATDIKMVHTHLHHAVNCLVGPKGDGFDAKEANPCASLGNGAIPDTTDSAMKTKLEDALKTAKDGIASDDLSTAQKDASQVADMLKSAAM